MDAEALEHLRRSIDLRLDAEGRWWHEGAPFEHPGVVALFDRGLDTHPETGEAIVRVGDQWAYVRVDDTPFVVRRLVEGEGGLWAELNNGERHEVPGDAFEAGAAGVVYLALTPRRRARLARTAQAALAPRIEAQADGTLVVRAGDRVWAVRG